MLHSIFGTHSAKIDPRDVNDPRENSISIRGRIAKQITQIVSSETSGKTHASILAATEEDSDKPRKLSLFAGLHLPTWTSIRDLTKQPSFSVLSLSASHANNGVSGAGKSDKNSGRISGEKSVKDDMTADEVQDSRTVMSAMILIGNAVTSKENRKAHISIQAISSLSKSYTLKCMLGRRNVAPSLVELLRQRRMSILSSGDVYEENQENYKILLELLTVLSEFVKNDNENKTRLGKGGIYSELVAILHNQTSNIHDASMQQAPNAALIEAVLTLVCNLSNALIAQNPRRRSSNTSSRINNNSKRVAPIEESSDSIKNHSRKSNKSERGSERQTSHRTSDDQSRGISNKVLFYREGGCIYIKVILKYYIRNNDLSQASLMIACCQTIASLASESSISNNMGELGIVSLLVDLLELSFEQSMKSSGASARRESEAIFDEKHARGLFSPVMIPIRDDVPMSPIPGQSHDGDRFPATVEPTEGVPELQSLLPTQESTSDNRTDINDTQPSLQLEESATSATIVDTAIQQRPEESNSSEQVQDAPSEPTNEKGITPDAQKTADIVHPIANASSKLKIDVAAEPVHPTIDTPTTPSPKIEAKSSPRIILVNTSSSRRQSRRGSCSAHDLLSAGITSVDKLIANIASPGQIVHDHIPPATQTHTDSNKASEHSKKTTNLVGYALSALVRLTGPDCVDNRVRVAETEGSMSKGCDLLLNILEYYWKTFQTLLQTHASDPKPRERIDRYHEKSDENTHRVLDRTTIDKNTQYLNSLRRAGSVHNPQSTFRRGDHHGCLSTEDTLLFEEIIYYCLSILAHICAPAGNSLLVSEANCACVMSWKEGAGVALLSTISLFEYTGAGTYQSSFAMKGAKTKAFSVLDAINDIPKNPMEAQFIDV